MRKENGLQGRPNSDDSIFAMLIEDFIDGGPGRNALVLAIVYPVIIVGLYALNSILIKIH